jgi:type VI secretion system protein ImpH
MSATQRRFQLSVEERLLSEPYRFEFFQAVRILELSLKCQGVDVNRALDGNIRFENSTSLSFPPSEIERLNAQTQPCGDSDATVANALPEPKRYYLTPSFMGFLGPNGTLPRHYSERIITHQLYKRDRAPTAFLDTYSNRAVALFYSAWKKYRLELEHESKGKNGFLPLLMSLGGLGYSSLRNRLNQTSTGIEDESLAFYAGVLRHRPMSAVYLEAVLSDYFKVAVKIEQFVGRWFSLPVEHQTALGLANAELGVSALSGQRVWQRDLRIGVKIGPLRKKEFAQFLPKEVASRALEQMLKMLVGLTLEFEVQLVLKADYVGHCDLSDHRTSGRLGWDTFLTTEKQARNRSDARYTLNALA